MLCFRHVIFFKKFLKLNSKTSVEILARKPAIFVFLFCPVTERSLLEATAPEQVIVGGHFYTKNKDFRSTRAPQLLVPANKFLVVIPSILNSPL